MGLFKITSFLKIMGEQALFIVLVELTSWAHARNLARLLKRLTRSCGIKCVGVKPVE